MASRTSNTPRRPRAAAQTAPQATTQPVQRGSGGMDPATREMMIRTAAYSLFERRGCVYGHALQDWLEAEAWVDAHAADATGKPAQE